MGRFDEAVNLGFTDCLLWRRGRQKSLFYSSVKLLKLFKLHNEELHNSYASPHIVRVIKWKGVRWAGHVARMGEMRNFRKF